MAKSSHSRFSDVIALARAKPVPHGTSHTTQSDFWGSVRMKPVKVTSIEGNTVYWEFQDTHTVTLGSFVTDERTKFPKGLKEGKTYLVVYCEEHGVAYDFQELK